MLWSIQIIGEIGKNNTQTIVLSSTKPLYCLINENQRLEKLARKDHCYTYNYMDYLYTL
jgi:hypothetical protein